jgi:phthiocerol/phenolphthiocerol synthesis type-I polyketide synthase E
VAGVPVERSWPRRPRRVPRPGYPYERTRRWIDPAPAVPVAEPVADQVAGPAPEGVVEVPVWHQIPATPAGPPPERCLVFAADQRGDGVASRLPGAVVVRPGEDVAHLPAPDRIVHAWALAGDSGVQAGYHSLLALLDAFPDARLDVLTADTEDPLGGDLHRPEHATVAGVVRVAPQERPGRAVRWIDVDTSSTVDEMLAELSRVDGPPAVALRRGRRWVRSFEATTPGAGELARPHGRYLITGGLGRVGSAIATQTSIPGPSTTDTNDDLTTTVTRVWRDVLNADTIAPDDDFFRAGGTSLVAAQLILRLRQATGVRLSMRVLFDAPTIAGMTAHIHTLRAIPPPRTPPIPRLRRPGRPS